MTRALGAPSLPLLVTVLAGFAAGCDLIGSVGSQDPSDLEGREACSSDPNGAAGSPRVVPSPANLDYFLSRSCYGLEAHAAEGAGADAKIYQGCKFIRWFDFTWKGFNFTEENKAASPSPWTDAFFDKIGAFNQELHRADPEMVVEAGFAEYICKFVIEDTKYDFSRFPELSHLYTGKGTFSFEKMRKPQVNPWGNNCCRDERDASGVVKKVCYNAKPDYSSEEGLKFLTWMAARYLRAGVESFYLAQPYLTLSGAGKVKQAAERLRYLGRLYGRRGQVLVGGAAYQGYTNLLVDSGGKPTVDYMKTVVEVDLVRRSGAGNVPAEATASTDRRYSCLESSRLSYESRLGRRLATDDLCLVDLAARHRDGCQKGCGANADSEGGKLLPNSAYGQETFNQAFWLASQNPARIPVVLELDGCQPVNYYAGPDSHLIRDNVNPQTAFFVSREKETRAAFIKYLYWVARHLTAREGVPVYAPMPIRVDQTYVVSSYQGLTHCQLIRDDGKPAVFKEYQAERCGDLGAVSEALTATPSSSALVLLTSDGQLVPYGGGFRTNRVHENGAFRALDAAFWPDQSRYALLTADGSLRLSRTASEQQSGSQAAMTVLGGFPNPASLDLDAGGRLAVLFKDGAQCAVALSSDGFKAKQVIPGCVSPTKVRLAGGRVFVLEKTGALWSRAINAPTWTRLDLAKLPAAKLAAQDEWVALTWAAKDGSLFIGSAFGKVVRLLSGGALREVRPASWSFRAAVALELLKVRTATNIEELLYLLDSHGGVHKVPLAGQASFPSMYPPPYYGGKFTGKYVSMRAVADFAAIP